MHSGEGKGKPLEKYPYFVVESKSMLGRFRLKRPQGGREPGRRASELLMFLPGFLLTLIALSVLFAPSFLVGLVAVFFLSMGGLSTLLAYKIILLKRRFERIAKEFDGKLVLKAPAEKEKEETFEPEPQEPAKKILYH